jgi:hypothetical protein
MTRIVLPPHLTQAQQIEAAARRAMGDAEMDARLAALAFPDMTPRIGIATVAATIAIVAATMLVGVFAGWFAHKAIANAAATVIQSEDMQ